MAFSGDGKMAVRPTAAASWRSEERLTLKVEKVLAKGKGVVFQKSAPESP